jgi:hypothetical protein
MKPQSIKINEKHCLKLTDPELILFLDIRELHHISLLCAFLISFNMLERWLSCISVLFVDFQKNGNAQN